MMDNNKNCLNCKYNVNKKNKNYCLICSGFYNGTDEMCAEVLCEKWEDAGMTGTMSLDMAIKALQQEDVIEKIRAEIKQRKKNSGGDPSRDLAFNVCLQIIDKYKAESEDKE